MKAGKKGLFSGLEGQFRGQNCRSKELRKGFRVARANRHYIPGCVWHITHRWSLLCHSVIWAFVKKLWGHGFGILGIIILFTLIEKAFENERSDAGTLLMILLQFIVYILVGFKGNEWRVNNLQKRGFELVDTLQAETPDAAIGNVAKT